MNIALKKKTRTIYVIEREAIILETINRLGPCSPFQVNDVVDTIPDLLTVMRIMHMLLDRGLLDRIVVDGQKLYKVKANYKNVKVHQKTT